MLASRGPRLRASTCGRPLLAPELEERIRQAMAVPGGPEGDCQAVRRVSDDGPERGQLGEADRRRAVGYFSADERSGSLQELSLHTNTPLRFFWPTSPILPGVLRL
jgi:hypothetical protein